MDNIKKTVSLMINKDRIIYAFIGFCGLLISMACSNDPFDVGNMYTDSAVYNYIGKIILSGGMPYRDVFDHKGPVLYLINALGQYLSEDYGVWVLEFVFLTLTLVYAYKISALYGCQKNTSFVIVFLTMLAMTYYLQGGNTPEEYTCCFLMISVFVFSGYFMKGKISPFSIILSGICFSLVFLMKANLCAPWGIMAIGVAISEFRKKGPFSKKVLALMEKAALFIGGVLLVCLPIVFWLRENDAFTSFVEEYFIFNSLYAKTGIKGLIISMTFFVGQPVAVITIPILFYLICDKKAFESRLYMVAFFGTVLAACLGNMQLGYYGFVFIPFFSWAISFLLGGKSFSFSRKTMPVLAMICLMFIQSFFVLGAENWRNIFNHHPEMAETKAITKVILDNTDDNDRISVCGNKCVLYLSSNRMSSSVYAYQNPIAMINPLFFERYLTDIEEKETKILVMTGFEMPSYADERMQRLLTEKYTLLEKIGTNTIYCLKGD